jgi:hypothetical protein
MSFFELFQPELKYLREEKERQKMLVSKPSHGGGAPLGIDLDAGTAKITITPRTDSAASGVGRPADLGRQHDKAQPEDLGDEPDPDHSSRTGVGGPGDLARQSRNVHSDATDNLDADHEIDRITDSVTREQ